MWICRGLGGLLDRVQAGIGSSWDKVETMCVVEFDESCVIKSRSSCTTSFKALSTGVCMSAGVETFRPNKLAAIRVYRIYARSRHYPRISKDPDM